MNFTSRGKKRYLFQVISDRHHCKEFFFFYPQFRGPWDSFPCASRVIFRTVFLLVWLKKIDSQKILSHLSFVLKTGYFQISTQHPEKVWSVRKNKHISTSCRGGGGQVWVFGMSGAPLFPKSRTWQWECILRLAFLF